jgi:hypothetical protein
VRNAIQTVCPATTKGTRHLNQGNKPGRLSPYSQAVEWQRKLNKASEEEGVKPRDLSMLARAWKEQEELKRKMRGVPDPRPAEMPPRRKRLEENLYAYEAPVEIGKNP